MNQEHKKVLSLGNHMRNMVGQPYYRVKPSGKKVLEELLDSMARASNGTCWAPVASVEDGKATSYNLYLNQCPGACGHVWQLNIRDKDMSSWLVNEINQRRHGEESKNS